MDNASYRKPKELTGNLKKFGGAVRMIYLPPHSPDLNPVEAVWEELKKHIANGTCERTEDAARAVG